MKLEDAVRAGLRLPVVRPGTVPVYVLGFAAVLAARVPIMLGLALAGAVLAAQGRVTPFLEELRGVEPGDIGPDGTLPPGLEEALGGLVTPASVGIVASAITATLLLALLGQAVASAASVHTVAAALGAREERDREEPTTAPGTAANDGPATVNGWRAAVNDEPAVESDRTTERSDPVLAGVRGVGTGTRTFGALVLARGAAGIGIPVVAFLLSGFLPTLAGSLLILAALVAGPLLYFALGFAEQAAAIEGHDAAGALSASLWFTRRNPEAFAGYLGVGGVTLAAVVIASMLADAFGVSAAVGLVVLVVAPLFFDGFKTALYAEQGAPANASGQSAAARAAVALRDGLRDVGGFVAGHPVAVLASGGLLAGGGLGGWLMTSQLGVELLTPGTAGGGLDLGLGVGVGIWINNWLVSAATAYGGFAVGLPTVTNLLFNGVVIGAIAGVVDPVAFVALVAPHGVIELPAIAIAGGLGLVLGGRGWHALRGRRDAAALAEDVREGFSVLLGLGVVLLVAGLIEALITPLVGSAVL